MGKFCSWKGSQALAIIQFKLENQLIKRRPEFRCRNHVCWTRLIIGKRKCLIDIKYPLVNTCFQTINPENQIIFDTRKSSCEQYAGPSFQRSSLKMAEHMSLSDEQGLYV